MNKEVIGYYQSNIKTSRNEDSVYAMKYASQQMLINKLQQENQQLHNKIDEISDFIRENKIKRYRVIEGEEYDEEIVLDEDDITCLERIINDEYDYENR